MKRTNLVLDEELLKMATRVLGEKTYSSAVNRSLQETIRTARIRGLTDLIGKGIWEGNLSEMREDSKPIRKKKRPY